MSYFYLYSKDYVIKINLVANEHGNYNGILEMLYHVPTTDIMNIDFKNGIYTYESDLNG